MPFKYETANNSRIRHAEMVGIVNGTTGFTTSLYSLNPGMSSTFPWLSTQAAGWEQYRFLKLRFWYIPRVATTLQGVVMLIPDYDAADNAPINEQIATSYEGAAEMVCWESFSISFSTAKMHSMGSHKFVRTGTLGNATTLDIKTYDVGTLFVAASDASANAAWGRLWVEYDVELVNPQLPSQGLAGWGSIIPNGGTVNIANPWGSTPLVAGGVFYWSGTNTIVFRVAGYYLVQASYAGTTITNTPPTVSYTATSVTNTDGAFGLTDGTTTYGAVTYKVSITLPGQSLSFNYAPSAATITGGGIRVSGYDPSAA